MARTIVQSSNTFRCDTCKQAATSSYDEFKNHLIEVHDVNVDYDLKGTKKMIMHIDGSGFHSSTYAWKLLNGVEFFQYVIVARNKR